MKNGNAGFKIGTSQVFENEKLVVIAHDNTVDLADHVPVVFHDLGTVMRGKVLGLARLAVPHVGQDHAGAAGIIAARVDHGSPGRTHMAGGRMTGEHTDLDRLN